ncbi:MAG: acyl carrier protein [Lachnospiraceae bacterium]|nr:acyl carrier protein [Parasporobacterium sp.]MBR4168442.1 acyl carrier protein [Lachnospiraceae bacterium]MCR4684411.1 acyl carrier protein [Lachnospiraceae bacterium]
MSREEVFDKVQEIFRDVFDDEELTISDQTNSDEIDEWDSLEHISLIISMEKEFSMKFDIKEVNKLENVGEMIDLIVRKMEAHE